MIKISRQNALTNLLQHTWKLVKMCLQDTACLWVSTTVASPHPIQLHQWQK